MGDENGEEVEVLNQLENEKTPEYLNLDVKPFWKRFWEVTYAFAPLGLVAFGGPAAHIGKNRNRTAE